jgi:uncharacterized membrane protein
LFLLPLVLVVVILLQRMSKQGVEIEKLMLLLMERVAETLEARNSVRIVALHYYLENVELVMQSVAWVGFSIVEAVWGPALSQARWAPWGMMRWGMRSALPNL